MPRQPFGLSCSGHLDLACRDKHLHEGRDGHRLRGRLCQERAGGIHKQNARTIRRSAAFEPQTLRIDAQRQGQLIHSEAGSPVPPGSAAGWSRSLSTAARKSERLTTPGPAVTAAVASSSRPLWNRACSDHHVGLAAQLVREVIADKAVQIQAEQASTDFALPSAGRLHGDEMAAEAAGRAQGAELQARPSPSACRESRCRRCPTPVRWPGVMIWRLRVTRNLTGSAVLSPGRRNSVRA